MSPEINSIGTESGKSKRKTSGDEMSGLAVRIFDMLLYGSHLAALYISTEY